MNTTDNTSKYLHKSNKKCGSCRAKCPHRISKHILKNTAGLSFLVMMIIQYGGGL